MLVDRGVQGGVWSWGSLVRGAVEVVGYNEVSEAGRAFMEYKYFWTLQAAGHNHTLPAVSVTTTCIPF